MRSLQNFRDILDMQGSSLGVFGLPACQPTNFTNASDAVWPVANLAIYMPIRVVVPTTVVNIAVGNGAVVAGNTDVGIYDENGVRIVSSGSTAQSGTSVLQLFDIADTLIGPGIYYLAIAHSEITGTLLRFTFTSAFSCQVIGMAEQTSAFPLPANATFASSTNNYMPVIACGTKGSGIV